MSTETVSPNRSFSIDLDSNNGDPFTAVVVNPPTPTPPQPEIQNPPVQVIPEEPEHSDEGQELQSGEGIQPEDPTQTPPVSGEESSDINPYYYLGGALKDDGELPDEFDVNEKVDGTSVYSAYKERLRERAEPEIRQEVYQKLQDEGVSAQELLIARAIRGGTDYRLLSAATMFEKYATLDDNSADTEKIGMVKNMYQLRGLKEEETNRLITSAEAEDNLDKLVVEGKQYFAGKWNEFVEAENNRYAESERIKAENQKKVNETIRTIVSTQEVLGDKLTKTQAKEFEDAIRKETIFEVDGTKYRGTEMQKFLLDLDRSPEMKFLLFKLYKFRNQDKEVVKSEVKKEVENEFLKSFENKILSSKKNTKVEQVKNQLETTKATAKSFFIDLSPKQ